MNNNSVIGAIIGSVCKVIVTFLALFVIYKCASACYSYGYRLFTEPAVSLGSGRTVTVEITEGMSPLEIGEYFEEVGLTRDAKLFALQYMFSEYKGEVKAGTFELTTAMTADEMMAVMAGETDEEETEEGASGEDSGEESSDDSQESLDQESDSTLLDSEENGDYSEE